MVTRSAKEAKKATSFFDFGPSDIGGRILKRKKQDADDLEQELARPSKSDYNQVRKALIIARWDAKRKETELEEKIRELNEKDRLITDREYQLLKCSEVHDKIREAQDGGSVLRKIDHDKEAGDDTPQDMSGEKVDGGGQEPKGIVREMSVILRNMIHKFADKYFSGKLRQPSTAQLGAGWAHQYMQATTPVRETYMNYLRSERRCPMIIEAFIWRFICGEIFNGAPWSGSEEMRGHVCGLQTLLTKFHNSTHSGTERMRNYQRWKMQTSKLVLEICEASATQADFHLLHLERHFANAISEVIIPFMRSSLVGHSEALIQIIHQAVNLDKMTSKQHAHYTWSFSPDMIESPLNFSLGQKKVMKLHPDEKGGSKLIKDTKVKVSLVVVPGLKQRGDDNIPTVSFEEERWILPIEVSCVKPRPQNKFGRAREGSDSTVE